MTFVWNQETFYLTFKKTEEMFKLRGENHLNY